MSGSQRDDAQLTKWDPNLVRRLLEVTRPLTKLWFRPEVQGLERLPAGGALLVSNHSGGYLPMDVPVFAAQFYAEFGYDKPLYTLTHDLLANGPLADIVARMGFIRASRSNAATALKSGGLVMVFPGGDYDVYRPAPARNVIDFAGRTGYVKTAIEAGVPIVPVVSIGGQENQLYLSRGAWLAKQLGLKRRFRAELLPISFGVPFGLAVLPVNVPLPTKLVTRVLDPIDIVAEFGDTPDVGEVDAHIRNVMQTALDALAAERRFPVLG
ncbi:lysophospholipid acyltransferase family protein [Mycobacterium sp. MAA66]|uniref:lysophospholipid acyltransferase family protein n=1 Tax=Mycobacterium sp. MAA66 TaxID=3156297 RepID=UPI003512CD13